MNGKQRARWFAELISDLQRLRKHTTGHSDDEHACKALQNLGHARDAALVETDEPAAKTEGSLG